MEDKQEQQIVFLNFNHWGTFEFTIDFLDDLKLVGHFKKNDLNKIMELAERFENESGEWYLGDDGYRLADEHLFQASPWSLLDNNNYKKIVSRFADANSGERSFALQPWFRITANQ